MDAREIKIERLKEYFQNRDDVVMAFLFGSQTEGSGRTHAHSDWDIGVYFKPSVKALEWEESGRDYPAENAVWRDCADILQTDDIDLLVLNRAPASIAETAAGNTPLIVKDHSLWVRFLRIVSDAAEEYRAFVDQFYAIAQRSRSLTPRDREDLKRTIQFIEEQRRLTDIYRQFTKEEFEKEPRKRNEMERWLENLMNAIIDISKVVLGSQKTLIPHTYRDMVKRAAHDFGLPEDFSEKFDHWVKIRNELAHEYLDIKWTRISEFAETSKAPIAQFVDAAKKFLDQEGTVS